MRVKVENDDGELIALLAVEEFDVDGIVGWTLYTQTRESNGGVWQRKSLLQSAASALFEATGAHRG